MKKNIILIVIVFITCSVYGQTKSKYEKRLQALLEKNPDKSVKLASKLLDKRKEVALAYHYLIEGNLMIYNKKGKKSYLNKAIRYYSKAKKIKGTSISQDLVNKLDTVHAQYAFDYYKKHSFQLALKEVVKHEKLFDHELTFIDSLQRGNSKAEVKDSISGDILKSLTTDDLLKEASDLLGTPYVYGGETPKGFDCSGFVKYVYSKKDIELPHNAHMISKLGEKVSKEKCLPGDLIFFGSGVNTNYRTQHVGIIYSNIDNQIKVIHCLSKGVHINGEGDESFDYYWKERILFIKRIKEKSIMPNSK